MIQDRFYSKTWYLWVAALTLGGLGLYCAVGGALFLTGMLRDREPQAGPPMAIIGSLLLAVAALPAFRIMASVRPPIRCYREGIECHLVGETSLDGVPLVPVFARSAWAILSLQGFRSQRLRSGWTDFRAAQVSGMPMAHVLVLDGVFTNQRTGHVANAVAFEQAELADHPDRIAETLNQFLTDAAARGRLPSWPSDADHYYEDL